ncbi:MAG: glucose-6-phosphate dehydrogenase (NADP(+)) [Chloroflexi bacterium]|nr:glucose-6-phosphate dehydrogenase (NADP(+)) [Chloroflexota bacterium]
MPEPSVMVIFGGTGDLTSRKLMPALYDHARQRLLPPAFAVVGVGRGELTDARHRAQQREAVAAFSRSRPIDDEACRRSPSASSTCRCARRPATRIRRRLGQLDADLGTEGDRLSYLATPPAAHAPIVRPIGRNGLRARGGWARVVVEKPFGRDLASALALSRTVREVLGEEEVFRILHYLGKETVQNILVFRFAGSIFEPVWGRRYVDHGQITVAATLGVEERTKHHDRSGAARGQYGPGFIEGEPVPGYHAAEGIPPESSTETFVAMKLFVDDWRWEGTPFHLRHGKRLPKRATEIAIQFRAVPHHLFSEEAREASSRTPSSSASSPRRGSRCASGRRSPSRGSASVRSRWISCTAPRSSSTRPTRTRRSSSTRSVATRRCSRARTRSRSSGASSTRRRRAPSSCAPRRRPRTGRSGRPSSAGWPRATSPGSAWRASRAGCARSSASTATAAATRP